MDLRCAIKIYNRFSYRSLQEAEIELDVERSQEINELTSIYTSLYKRDYYVKMEENTINSSNDKVLPAVKKKEVGLLQSKIPYLLQCLYPYHEPLITKSNACHNFS